MTYQEHDEAVETLPSSDPVDLPDGRRPVPPRRLADARDPVLQEDLPRPRLPADAPVRPAIGRRAPGARRRVIMSLGLLLAATALPGGWLYLDNAGHFETTDDAFIAARQFAIAPKVSGYITAVPVTDNEHVAAGEVIARIDERDYRVALAQAEAQVAAAQANIENIDAQTAVQQAQVAQASAGRAGPGQPGLRSAAGVALPGPGPHRRRHGPERPAMAVTAPTAGGGRALSEAALTAAVRQLDALKAQHAVPRRTCNRLTRSATRPSSISPTRR